MPIVQDFPPTVPLPHWITVYTPYRKSAFVVAVNSFVLNFLLSPGVSEQENYFVDDVNPGHSSVSMKTDLSIFPWTKEIGNWSGREVVLRPADFQGHDYFHCVILLLVWSLRDYQWVPTYWILRHFRFCCWSRLVREQVGGEDHVLHR
jgi:hypothetical protein